MIYHKIVTSLANKIYDLSITHAILKVHRFCLLNIRLVLIHCTKNEHAYWKELFLFSTVLIRRTKLSSKNIFSFLYFLNIINSIFTKKKQKQSICESNFECSFCNLQVYSYTCVNFIQLELPPISKITSKYIFFILTLLSNSYKYICQHTRTFFRNVITFK